MLNNYKMQSVTSIVAALLLSCFNFAAEAASPVAIQALVSNPALEYAPDSVLIRFKEGTSAAQRGQARVLVSGQQRRGFGIVKALEHLQLGHGQGVENAIQVLQKLPFVSYVEPDYVRRADTNDTYFGLQWGLNNTGQDIRGVTGVYDADIDAPEAWSYSIGDPGLAAC